MFPLEIHVHVLEFKPRKQCVCSRWWRSHGCGVLWLPHWSTGIFILQQWPDTTCSLVNDLLYLWTKLSFLFLLSSSWSSCWNSAVSQHKVEVLCVGKSKSSDVDAIVRLEQRIQMFLLLVFEIQKQDHRAATIKVPMGCCVYVLKKYSKPRGGLFVLAQPWATAEPMHVSVLRVCMARSGFWVTIACADL